MKTKTHSLSAVKFLLWHVCAFLLVVIAAPAQTNVEDEIKSQVSALEKTKAQAVDLVKRIVNQPVQKYAITEGMHTWSYPDGWFHPGAIAPAFDKVDVRQTQETPYDSQDFVTSPLNPGVAFRGADLEFNPMTKYFYTDRSVPKKKLTEAQMIEINKLYRTIGKCDDQIRHLVNPPPDATDAAIARQESGIETITNANSNTNATTQSTGQEFPKANFLKLKIGLGVALVAVLAVLYFTSRKS